ncbi:MAG: ABC transporter substrate-binding protein [Candidatus Rokuibacteriota bacterium]
MNRRPGRLVVALVALTLTALAVSPLASPAAEREVRFLLDFIPGGFHAPWYAAVDKGFFKEEGLDVKISRGYGSGDTVMKIAAGQGDVGLATIGALIAARANENVPAKGVMLYVTRDMLTMWVRDEGKINHPRDLEGKTVATTPGNAHFVMFPAFAKAAGFDESKIKWVTVDGAVMGPMLINKQIDAAPYFWYHAARIRPMAAERGVTLKPFPYGDYGLKLYSSSLIARDETVQKDPDMLARFVRATLRAMRWAADNVDEATRSVMKFNPEATFAAAKGEWELSKEYIFVEESAKDGQGIFEAGKLQSTIDQLVGAMRLKRAPTAAEVATNQFVGR